MEHLNNLSAACEMIYQMTNQAKQQLTHQQKSKANTNNRRSRLPRKLFHPFRFVLFRYRSRNLFRDCGTGTG